MGRRRSASHSSAPALRCQPRSRKRERMKARERQPERKEVWTQAVDELLSAYIDVQRRALALHWKPDLRAVRQLLRERRRNVWLRFGTTVGGELNVSGLAPSGLLKYLLAEHFGSRLKLLRVCILVDNDLSSDDQDQLLLRIDRLLPLWPQRPVWTFFYQYLLPLSALASALVRPFATSTDPELAFAWPFLALAYAGLATGVVGLAFVVKRGLMLGGEGTAAYVPAFLEGTGAYGTEAKIFGILAPSRREMPLDLILIAAAAPLVTSYVFPMLLLPPLGIPPQVPTILMIVVTLALWSACTLAYLQRRRRGRC